jgi:hypothetical protein
MDIKYIENPVDDVIILADNLVYHDNFVVYSNATKLSTGDYAISLARKIHEKYGINCSIKFGKVCDLESKYLSFVKIYYPDDMQYQIDLLGKKICISNIGNTISEVLSFIKIDKLRTSNYYWQKYMIDRGICIWNEQINCFIIKDIGDTYNFDTKYVEDSKEPIKKTSCSIM